MPDPLTPADCDVRHLDCFMLNVDKLMASELWALSTGEEFKAAFALWARAWKQVPAASLPDDDRVLSAFSGAGQRWKKIKEMALRGFVKCSDGRLYHSTLANDALNAWSKTQAYRDRAKKGAKGKWNKNASSIAQASSKHCLSDASSIQEADDKQCLAMPIDRDRDIDISNIPLTSFEGERAQSKTELDEDRTNAVPRVTKPKGKTNGTRLSPDWKPCSEDIEYAKGRGFDERQIADIAENFRDYWLAASGQKASKCDWNATWRNWCQNQDRFGPSSSNGRQTPRNHTPSGSIAAAALAVLDRSSQVPMGADHRDFEPKTISNGQRIAGNLLSTDHPQNADFRDNPMLSGDSAEEPGADGFGDDDSHIHG